MSSPCVLYLDEIELTIHKFVVPVFLSALFQEGDRVKDPCDEAENNTHFYRAPRDVVLRRLDLMGCTIGLCKRRFSQWVDETIREIQEHMVVLPPDEVEEFLEDLQALQELSWANWRQRVPAVLSTRFISNPPDEPVDRIDERMKDLDNSWLWFDGPHSLISLRAVIDACNDTQTITLDLSGLIAGGWASKDFTLHPKKNHVISARGDPQGPIIVLAEGPSDINILKASLTRFHPELVDFITFLDHTEFKVDGGASYVVKFLKAFAAARIPANFVAVFDNDTAGRIAYSNAKSLNLPENMECVHLPDIELAKSYPTIGPQGAHDVDVNGRACGIELYLGRKHLSHGDALRPVMWGGYDHGANQYQGEVENKTAVQRSFLDAMKKEGSFEDSAYPELKQLWQTIIEAASRVAEVSQYAADEPR